MVKKMGDNPMTFVDFLIIVGACLITMLLCRVTPIFALRGRQLPQGVVRALGLIPPAAFAALVANDLIGPAMFQNGVLPGMIPLLSALVTFVVGYATKSLVWCIVAGVGSYGLMMLLL